MTAAHAQIQCTRCGQLNRGHVERCDGCGEPLRAMPFVMTTNKIRKVKAMARNKGLIDEHGDDDDYRFFLSSNFGITSCLDMKEGDFLRYIERLNNMPDAA